MKDVAIKFRRGARGLSVIDALIAFVITIIGLTTLMTAVPLAFASTDQSAVQIQAIAAAQQQLEAIRRTVAANGNATMPTAPTIAIDAGESMLGSGTPATSAGDFSFSDNGCPLVSGSTVRYDCSVTVRWAQGGAPRSLTLETYVTHQ